MRKSYSGACALLFGMTFLAAMDAYADDEKKASPPPSKPTASGVKNPEKAPSPDPSTPSNDAPASAAPGKDTNSGDPDQVLTGKGLKRDDRRYVLDESAAIDKYESIRQLHEDYQKAWARAAAIVDYDDTLANLQAQQKDLQAEVQALQAEINRVNSSMAGSRRFRGFANTQTAGYRQQENQIKNQINQTTQQINSMKSNAPKAAERNAAAPALDMSRNTLTSALKELEALVTPLTDRYHALALDPDVTKALAELRHDSKLNYKLGPSDKLAAAARLIKDLKLAPRHPKSASSTKPASKPRRAEAPHKP